MDDFVIPDLVGSPFEGWRTWYVVPREKTQGALVLRSFIHADVWEPGETFAARCQSIDSPLDYPHVAPDDGCECGIYALKEPEGLDTYYRQGAFTPQRFKEIYRVRGTVALWGKVVPGEHGYRAQYAYPTRIEIPRKIRGRESLMSVAEISLALEAYRVTVEVVDDVLDLTYQ